MTPQHSSPPGRAFRFGMFTRLYVRMKCYRKHNSAIYFEQYDASLSVFRSGLLSKATLVRYSYHCFRGRFQNYATTMLFFNQSLGGWFGLPAPIRLRLISPGNSPRHNNHNDLSTVCPFPLRCLSWAVKHECGASGSTHFFTFFKGGFFRRRNWFTQGRRNQPTITVPK